MKLTSIGMVSSNGTEVATFSFRDPGSLNPYIARAILGLDAEEIVPRFYGMSFSQGKKYYSLSLPPRDIVLQILLNPNFTMEKSHSELRDELYRAISSSRTGIVTLKFYNEDVEVAQVSGFVTKFANQLFEQQPQVDITLNCEDPMLRSPVAIDIPAAVEAPGNAPPITDDLSTAPHGFAFRLHFTADTTQFYIQDTAAEWRFTVVPGVINGQTGFKSGDELVFSSDHTGRVLTHIRGPVQTPIVDKIQPGSVWPILFHGLNQFENTPEVSWFYIRHYPAYWGV
jgi:hypothetical protein